jgi:hypothetical protein
MRNIFFAVLFLFCSVLDISAQVQKSAEARNTDLAWERVSNIKSQQMITVHLRDGKKLKGAFVQADENGIMVRTKADKSMQIGREEILRISSRSWGKGALIGLGIGAGTGAFLGGVRPPIHDAGASLAGNVVGVAAIGGLIGFAAGAGVGKGQTIYQSPTAQTEARK